MRHMTALYAIKTGLVKNPRRKNRDIPAGIKGKLYKAFENSAAVAEGSPDYRALVAARPKPAKLHLEILGKGNLPWPLQVLWPGGWHTQSKADHLVRSLIFAKVEQTAVDSYRIDLIRGSKSISRLRNLIQASLSFGFKPGYQYPDGIDPIPPATLLALPEEDIFGLVEGDENAALFDRLTREMEDIVRTVAKKSFMLAIPGGTHDNHHVRSAFQAFLDVSLHQFL